MLVPPRSLIGTLHRHWEVIERLIIQGSHLSVLTHEMIISAVKQAFPEDSPDRQNHRLDELEKNGILEQVPRSSDMQLNEIVRQFASSLLHEHTLGLSDVMQARMSKLKESYSELLAASDTLDFGEVQRFAVQIDSELRKIIQQLKQDRHAIADIAQRAKSANVQLSIERRYREVLEAWDQYVDPMTELMDTGAKGEFYFLLEKMSLGLDSVIEQLILHGGLHSHRVILLGVGYRVKELRKLGRDMISQCTEELMPLREELRKHNRLATAISRLVGDVRKRGAKKTFNHDALPLWRGDRGFKLIVGDDIKDLLSAAKNYKPRTVTFPDKDEEVESFTFEPVDEQTVLNHLLSDLPVDNLLTWLNQQYEYDDLVLIRLYHRLIQRKEVRSELQQKRLVMGMKRLRISLHPHRIDEPVCTQKPVHKEKTQIVV